MREGPVLSGTAKILLVAFILFGGVFGQVKKPGSTAARPITVITEPDASVWIDGVLFGKAGPDGRLLMRSVPAGNRTLRVRLAGFKEARKPLAAAKGEVAVPLVRTTDEAELAFQQAESLTSSDRQKAIAAFEKAVTLRPRYPEAILGLARALSDSGDFDRALKAIRDLKKIKPRYAEASAVEGRIYKDVDDEKAAVAAFKRAIAEGGGYQPEAYTGLGLLYKDKAENAASTGDVPAEASNYVEAARYLAAAVKQLGSAPDAVVVYQLLGLVHERQKEYTKAIAVYEEFLRLFPDSPESDAVRSFIVQIKKQMAEPD
jgi:tetratricopeptide (TPR) repeat protein